MSRYMLLVFFLLVSLTNFSCAGEVKKMKITRCGMLEDFFRLSFASADKKKAGFLSIHPNDKTIQVSLSRKIAFMEWKYIKSLRLKASGNFVVEFTDEMAFVSGESVSELDYGLLDVECWKKLEKFVDGGILLVKD